MQVLTDATTGAFSFTLTSPFATSGALLRAYGVDGASYGERAVTFNAPGSLRFDFNSTNNLTQTGFLAASTATYTAARGYGWDVSPSAVDRGASFVAATGKTSTDLYRDIHYAGADRTFRVNRLHAGAHDVRVYLGDPRYNHDQMVVTVEGLPASAPQTTAAGTGRFIVLSFSGAMDANANGTIEILFHDNGGGDANWAAVGVDLALPGMLPGQAPLTAEAAAAPAGEAPTAAQLAPLAQEGSRGGRRRALRPRKRACCRA